MLNIEMRLRAEKWMHDRWRGIFCTQIIATLFIGLHLHGQNGLTADFYDGQNFDRYVSSTVMNNIDMSWNNTPPVPGIDPHVCSIRWTGRLKAPESGYYRFSARVDDGIRVWVGDQLVIDDWQLNDVGIFKGEAYMEAGKYYNLKVEYFNALIEGEIRLLWKIPEKKSNWLDKYFGKKPEIIDAKYFYQPNKITTKIPEDAITDISNVPSTPTPRARKVTPKKEPVKATPQKEEEKTTVATPPPARKIPTMANPEMMTTEVIEMFTPHNVQFEQAQVDILASSYSGLDTLGLFLTQNDFLSLKIEGHTDVAGDPDKNMELSERRAYAVARYLVKNGVRSDRITAEGFGGSKPLVKTFSKIYHPENRRVSFIITVPE